MQPSKSIALGAVLAVLLAWPALAQALKVGTVNVSHNGAVTVLKVSTEGKAEPAVSILDGNKALIVVPGGSRAAMAPLKVKSGILQGIRFGAEGGDLRIVADLRQAGSARLGKVGDKGFEVELSAATTDAPAAKAEAKPKAEARAEANDNDLAALNPASAGYTYRLVDLALGGDADEGELVISSDGPASYKSSLKEDGKLLSLTFRNSSLAWAGDGAKLSDASVSNVAVRQASEGGETLVKVDVHFREKLAYNLKRDQNQLVVRFNRPEAKQEAPKKGDLQALVSVDVEDADIVSVLKALCQQAGFEYQFTKDILGKTPPENLVTLRVKNRPFDEVTGTILAQVAGSYIQEGNSLYFGNLSEIADKKARLPLEQRYYEPKYLTLAQMTKVLTIYFAKKPDLVTMLKADPVNSARYMLVGPAQDISDVMDAIRIYDKPEEGEQAAASDSSGGNGTRTQVFHLQYLTDDSLVAPAIKQLYTDTGDDQPQLMVDGPSRTMVVTTKLKYLRKIEKLLSRLDVKPKQVNIEAKIVEVNQGMQESLGIDWSAARPSAGIGDTSKVNVSGGALGIVVGMARNGTDINAALNAAISQNSADILSSPNVTTRDNKLAHIAVQDSISFAGPSDTLVSNGVPIVIPKTNTQTFPLTLDVTPIISEAEQRVLMLINFDFTTQTGSQVGTANAPTSQQVGTTTVSVNSGQTTVIGGLVKQSLSSITKKVPILGDIPLLGLLFKFQSSDKSKKEIIIFITPTIVED